MAVLSSDLDVSTAATATFYGKRAESWWETKPVVLMAELRTFNLKTKLPSGIAQGYSHGSIIT